MKKVVLGDLSYDQMQGCLRDLVGVYDIDSFPVNDSTLGQWMWVKQKKNNIDVRYFNNLPFKVEVYGDALKGGVRRKNRIFVRIVPDSTMKCDVRSANVKVRGLFDKLPSFSLCRKLKWSEQDGGFVGYVTTDRHELGVDVEFDGYVDRTCLICWSGGRRRWVARRRSSWQPRMSWGVTDKNMYKPDETVKWKFVMNDSKGRPCKGEAVVTLGRDTVYKGSVDKQGVIYGETVLADSFNLKSGDMFMLTAKVGKQEKRLYCTYKDYELKSLTVTADVERYEVVHGDTIKVRVNATDERGKLVMQGKVWGFWRLLGHVSGMDGDVVQFSNEKTPLDTLEIKNGEAALEIPTANLPMADLTVTVDWGMRTAEGEERTGREHVTCKRYPSAELRGTGASSSAELRGTEKQYFITGKCLADSVEFGFDGYGEMFNWVVIRNGKEMASGRDTLLDWKTKESGMADYTCVVVKDGKTWNKTVNHSSDMLKVTVGQKNKVNPGEEDEIIVWVTDNKGRPVADADVTSLAATSKLGYNVNSPILNVKSKYSYDGMSFWDFDSHSRYCELTDGQLAELIEADKTQYWKLMNAKDSIVVVETPSSVGSQIVPVLVRNGWPLSVTRVIINDKTYLPQAKNRYVAIPRLGKNYVCFSTGDTVYVAWPEITDTLPLKRWLGIPAESCKKIACSQDKEQSLVETMFSQVVDYEGRGMPFLLRDGEIIPLSAEITNKVTGTGLFAVGVVNIDSLIERENIILGFDKTVSLWHEPTVIQYESYVKEKPGKKARKYDVRLNDSLCTIEELRQEWIEKLDEIRGNDNDLDRNTISGVRDCMVFLVNNEGEKHPLQVCYREKDSTEWINKPLRGTTIFLKRGKMSDNPSAELRDTGAFSEERDYEILFMYEGGVTRRVNVQTSEKDVICVRSSCREGEGVVDKKLEYEMRKRMEEKCEKKTEKYRSVITFGHDVWGQVIDSDGNPLIGAAVQVEGTNIGTTVGENGRFTINVPIGKRVLVFSMIGMQTVKAEARKGMTVTMQEDETSLNEVMVVGYGSSSYAMAGEVAGVQVVGAEGMPGTNSSVRIRGIGSVNSSMTPLYVVNGVPFDGDISSLDPSLIASTTVLKDETATSLYGSRGANGVILITIGGQEVDASLPDDEIDLRENFNDVAFFVPDCRTDKDGRAVVKVKYPDDLTSWSEWFVAIKGKQRGVARSVVKAEKQHEAKLNMPRFAVEGDTVGAVGVGVDRIKGESVSDTLHAVAEGDSLCMQFSYKTDGEKRCVKVYPQGLQMIEGHYFMMDSDSVATLAYKPEYGEMKVGVYGDAREMMMSSVEKIAKQDWCGSNDFLANRLRALKMLPTTKERSREIEKIEKTLRKNRGENGMWCWWGKPSAKLMGTVADMWVTERVLEALGMSENETALESELAFRREKYRGKWDCLLDIAKLYKVIGHEETAKEIALEIPDDSIRNTYLRIEKQMMEGYDVRFDTMRHATYTDGSYYSYRKGDSCWRNVTAEEVWTTMQAYRYFEKKNDRKECKRIKRWLLQYSFGGVLSEWFEMQIVKTLWNDGPIEGKDTLWQISVGGKSLEKLPYHTTVDSEAQVDYRGLRDIYVSTEQNWWNKTPEAQGNGMTINTVYDKGVLTVEVTVEKTAENVIVSIPVPAGCSYSDNQEKSNSEMYREEYRDRVNIYCYQLREGKHTFKVRLNERYPGAYTLNPAQVRLVDYPVFNANNETKKVRIK